MDLYSYETQEQSCYNKTAPYQSLWNQKFWPWALVICLGLFSTLRH